MLSAIRGGLSPPKTPKATHFTRAVFISLIDGLAATGGIFASLEGGKGWAVWLCVGAAALSGVYSLPIKYEATFRQWPKVFNAYAHNGKTIVALLTLTATVLGIAYVNPHPKSSAWGYAILTTGPSLLLLFKDPPHTTAREPGKATFSRVAAQTLRQRASNQSSPHMETFI